MEVSDVKIPWNAKSRRYFHFKLPQGDEDTRVISLCRGKLEKIKQKERNRLPAYVTNVGMPMVKNIEWTSCLDYPQQRIYSFLAALSFIDFKVYMTDSFYLLDKMNEWMNEWMNESELYLNRALYTPNIIIAIIWITMSTCDLKTHGLRKNYNIYESNKYNRLKYLTIIPWARVGYEMIDSQWGA